MTTQEKINAVQTQNIPILNDNLEALREVCKVVTNKQKIGGGAKYYYYLNGDLWPTNGHPNSHLAIPASEFFEGGKDTTIVEVALHAADLWHDEAKDRTDLNPDFKSYYEGFKDGMKHGMTITHKQLNPE